MLNSIIIKMSKLKNIREKQNLTQEELSEKSAVSVRTIQRIEAGKDPKGYTLRVLAKTLGVNEKELIHQPLEVEDKEEPIPINYSKIKLINLSSLPFVVVPLLNIFVPLLLMFILKLKHPITKQIISLQMMWTIVAPIIFMLGIFLKLGRSFTLILIIVLLLSNIYIVLRNAVEIDQKKKLRYQLNFSMI